MTGLVLFGLAVASQFVSVTYGGGGAKAPPVRREAGADRWRLQLVEDAIPVLRLSGTHYEIGRQHGALLKKQVRFLYREYFEAVAVPPIGRKNLEAWAKSVEPHIPKHYKEEMRGLAAGSGLTYEQVLLVNTCTDKLQSIMCSTVVASGKASEGGEVYFGRNLDFPGRNLLHATTVVLVLEPEGTDGRRKEPLVSVTWPGVIGVLSGMTARGLAGATMMIHFGKRIQPGMPYMLMYREALVRARKLGDIRDYIRQARRTCPNNFMVVDAGGAAEVIEFDQETVMHRPASMGMACSTNHFRSKELEGVGLPLGLSRYRKLERFLDRERGGVNLAKIKHALESVATPWFLNVQSMVFLPAHRPSPLRRRRKADRPCSGLCT